MTLLSYLDANSCLAFHVQRFLSEKSKSKSNNLSLVKAENQDSTFCLRWKLKEHHFVVSAPMLNFCALGVRCFSSSYVALRNIKTFPVIFPSLNAHHDSSQINNNRSASWATDLVNGCSETERRHLYEALQNSPSIKALSKDSSAVSLNQLRLGAFVWYFFISFSFSYQCNTICWIWFPR